MQNLLEQQDLLQDALQDEAIEDVDNVMSDTPATAAPKQEDAKVDPPAAVKKVDNPDDIKIEDPEEKKDAAPALNSADPAKGLKEEEKKEEEKKEEAAEAKPAKAADTKVEKEAAKKAEPKEEKEVKKLEKEVPDLDKKKYPGCPSTECVGKMADEV